MVLANWYVRVSRALTLTIDYPPRNVDDNDLELNERHFKEICMSEKTAPVQERAPAPQHSAAPYLDIKTVPFKVRIALARTGIDYIQKRGKNDFHKYAYAQAGDVQGVVGKVLAEHGIIMGKRNQTLEWDIVKTSQNKEENRCRLTAEFGLIDAHSDESIWYPMFGEGRDTADKAYYKASTGARKYALIDALCLGIGDDPEASGDAEREDGPQRGRRREPEQPEREAVPLTAEQAAEISSLCNRTATDPMRIVEHFKVPSLEFVPFNDTKRILENKLAKMLDDAPVEATASGSGDK